MAVSLHDVENVPAFVRATVERWRSGSDVRLAPGEHAELVAEGVVAVYELAARYEDHRTGYERPGSFAGMTAQLLPRDSRTRGIGCIRSTTTPRGADGRREWRYLPPALSLDALAEERPHALASARPIVAPPALRRPAPGQLVLDLAAAA